MDTRIEWLRFHVLSCIDQTIFIELWVWYCRTLSPRDKLLASSTNTKSLVKDSSHSISFSWYFKSSCSYSGRRSRCDADTSSWERVSRWCLRVSVERIIPYMLAVLYLEIRSLEGLEQHSASSSLLSVIVIELWCWEKVVHIGSPHGWWSNAFGAWTLYIYVATTHMEIREPRYVDVSALGFFFCGPNEYDKAVASSRSNQDSDSLQLITKACLD
jgi:hypothetical protein